MSADCYKIDVIHYLNPSLIWVEVCNSTMRDDFVFEQVGIYGLIPHETTIDMKSESVVTSKCTDWVPAVNTILKSLLLKCKEVWFQPTHIDRRSSIFDDNIHKYGELIIQNFEGKVIKVSECLVKNGFAKMDICEFHRLLSNGKLNTDLDSIRTQEVVSQIEKYYTKSAKTKNWDKSLKKQTSVFQIKQQFESELTVSNLEKHNSLMISKLIENKNKDFDLCKDIDDKPLGRGVHKANSVKSELNSRLLRKKTSRHEKTTFHDIKRYIENSSKPTGDSECSSPCHVENGEKSLSGRLSKISDHNLTAQERRKLPMSVKGSCEQNSYKENTLSEICKITPATQVHGNDMKGESKAETNDRRNTRQSAPDDIEKLKRKRFNMNSENSRVFDKLVAFGPPGLNPNKLKVERSATVDVEDVKKEPMMNNGNVEKVDCFDNVDSDVGYKFDISFNSIQMNDRLVGKGDDGEDSVSSVLQRRLTARTGITNKESSISSSDSNVESSSFGENKESFDDDEVLEIIDKKYSKLPSLIVDKNSDPAEVVSLTNYVNPFKNVDSSISVFVDKLVTPVLMVHSKSDKRIEPVFHLRDVNFNPHIRHVLRNMNIDNMMMLQTVSWNTILRGCSLFMVSPMGSGKTLGYLPAVCRLVSDGSDINGFGPMCIIVCATAKSVTEVQRMAKMFLGLNERVLACYAGVDDSYITIELLNGCDLFICTPPSLCRLLQSNDFGIDLRRLSILVLDDCERLTQTYSDELKFLQIKINAMLKTRLYKQLKVQYILASRIWCDYMVPLAKRAPDTIVCIGAFQECVLYSKANTTISFIKSGNKLNHIFEFLNNVDSSKKTVIVCESDAEVELLQKALKDSGRVVFACDSNMTVHDLYTLSESWVDYKDPVEGPILVCCDGNLTHMNVTDAYYLVHYSLPQYFSMFCKRFAVLNDNYPSIFKTDDKNIKIKILLEETNVLQLPKIINFIKRCTDKLPSFLGDVCARIFAEKDSIKAQRLVPLCDNLLQLGVCPDFYNCQERHTIFKKYDTPKEWIPTHGIINFKIIHYHTAALYSARLLSVSVNGATTKFPQTYSTLSLKMGLYFAKESNRKLHGMPEIGDVCAVAKTINFFARCQVIKVLSRYQRGNPNKVLVKLVDEEKYEITRDIYLYYLPDDLKRIETNVVQIRLANLEPKDRDITFSDLARDSLKKITDEDDEVFMRGQVSLALGNCIFVTTLDACQDLSSLNETVVKFNFKHELLKNHALLNAEHLSKIKILCENSGLKVDGDPNDTPISQDLLKRKLPKASWAHLESDGLFSVYFASAISPDKFFVRLEKFESCMITLLEDIKSYVEINTNEIGDIEEGDIVLAKFPDDSTYERARIDNIDGVRVKCFFVDQGDWREMQKTDLIPIQEKFVTKLPFQAIECRLVGVKPPGEEWTDYSTNWFYDNCFNLEDLKHLFVKFYTKEPAEFTGGYKYGVVLIDTTSEQDTIINEVMIDLNLAREDGEELKYFENIHRELEQSQTNKDENLCVNKMPAREAKFISDSDLLQQPIRSVPLVNTDDESEDSDKWEVNISASTATELIQNGTDYKNEIANCNGDILTSETKVSAIKSKRAIQELDSDDFTSPELTEISNTPEKRNIATDVDQKRRPKLIWRQNKSIAFVKIQIVVENYVLHLDDRRLEFNALANDTKYEIDIELCGVIKKEESSHVNKGQYILVKLVKVLKKNWLTLTRSSDTKNWVVYDVDYIDTSSDEEMVDETSIVNIVKKIHEKSDTESEDDEFEDDANFTYKK